MIHSSRSLLVAPVLALVVQFAYADDPAKPVTETLKGQYTSARFRPDDWKVANDPKEFMKFLDEVYLTMVELTSAQPPMELRGYEKLGAWGTAGIDGINIDWTCIQPFLKDFNNGKVEFGFVHEMGHVFDARDFPRWYITPGCGGETFANIKLSYALERLLLKENKFRIEFGPGGLQTGYDFNNNFYLNAASKSKYLTSDTPWDKMGVDDLHAFHLNIIRKVGWDVYKKWFRAYYKIEAQKDGRAPAGVADPLRINLICALLSTFSGQDLVPDCQKWRMPVTDKSVLEVAKRYDLKKVCPAVDAQFAEEYAAGKIHLDPLSLQIRIAKNAAGKPQATIFSIMRSTPSVTVRYSFNSTPVTATSKTDSGAPIPVAVGNTINAAMFVPGKPQPVLTATAKVEP